METGLRDRVAVVAGASAGLGKAAARALAAEGVKLAICSRSEQRINAAAEEIRTATGAEVLALAADLSKPESSAQLVRAAVERYGRLDVLVTNAGGPPPGTFDDITDEQWEAAFQTTLMSAVRLSREALPHMRARKWGRIINFTSSSVKAPIDRLLLSNAMRAAVVGMAKTLSNEVASEGITVNNIGPGRIYTDRIRQLDEDRAHVTGSTPEDVQRQWAAQIPARRYGDPEEMASLTVFLASEQASYITGTTVQVDGGMIRSLF